jgi:hypothetical protein
MPLRSEQAVDEGSRLNTTGFPEPPPVAVGAYDGLMTDTPVGALEVKVTLWGVRATGIDWVTWGAGSQLVSPLWLKSRMQVPWAVKVTVPEARVQPEELVSREMTTGRPEVAVAEGV